ncbi:glycosyltransferase family 4 protein [Gaoshiqia sediminis]|uniref:Glycosyltransferase family 4 protein n=1 Tax=Gaoshiqia sediminis TaxID=2986998 RepID=A0AA41Y2P1_9BACT|nr:glycosyltransferase family 4 protein [Gaoshiqia sediminis]MCW0482346.1 glycosyltransferase family 4 protein [Gaoshiqia sediminis]
MRILQLTNKVPWPPNDGGAIAVLTLSKGFFLHGHQVTVLAMNTDKHHVHSDEIPEHLRQQIDFRLVDVSARITPYGVLRNLLFSDLPYHAERFLSEDYNRALIRLLDEEYFDVIQLEGLYLCPYIPLIREHSKALIAYRAHNIEYEIWQRTERLAKGFRKIYLKLLSGRLRKFERSFLNKYDVLVPITDRDGAILDQMGNTKNRHTSQAGIDLSTLVPTAKGLEYPSLFYIGALDWGPNQEGLLWFLKYCWPRILQNHPGLKFYVAGRNAPAWLEARLKTAGLVYLGEVDDAHRFMSSKAIMLVPLFSGSGMRVKIVEGMALGKAIISTSIGCEGIPAKDRETVLIADDADSFVRAVAELAANKSLFDKLCKQAVDLIRVKFDNLAIVGSLIDFYKQHLHD